MTFVYPYMLWGLLALVVPVVVHLFYLRRWKKLAFSNVRMLQDVRLQTRKKQRLKDRLLLLSRLLAIFCLVMAFAQPRWGASAEELQDEKVRFTSLFVDNSFSMQGKTTDGDLLSDAKRQAYEWVKRFRPSDKFHLLTQDFSQDQQRWVSREEVLEEIQSLDISPYAHPLSAVMARQEQVLLPLAEMSPRAVVISDFQKTFADLEKLSPKPPCRRIFCPLAGSDSDNISVDSLALESPVLQKGQSITLKIFLRNQSRDIREEVSVKVLINGKVEAVSSCRLLAQESLEVELPLRLKEEGWLQGRVEIEDYPIQFDDRLFFSLHVLDRIPLLQVYDERPNPFLDRLFLSDEAFDYQRLPLQNLDVAELHRRPFLLLPEAKNLSSGLQAELLKALEQGATLFVAPHAGADFASLNALTKALFASSLEPLQSVSLELAAAEFSHPLLRAGIQKIPEQNLWPKVNQYFPLREKAPARFQTLMRLNNGQPFLVHAPYGEGNAYLLTAPLTAEASDFVAHPLFVLSFVNMALQSAASERLYYDLLEQDRVLVRSLGRSAEEPPLLRSEEKAFEMRPQITYQGNRWKINTHFALHEAGNYSLGSAQESWAMVAFNYSRQESDRSFYSPQELRKRLADGGVENIQLNTQLDTGVDGPGEMLTEGFAGWKLFIALCLLFLLAELFILKFWFIFAKQKE